MLPRSDAAKRDVRSGSILFATHPLFLTHILVHACVMHGAFDVLMIFAEKTRTPKVGTCTLCTLRFQTNSVETQIRHHITKTRLYNFDPLKPHFYIVKLGFTGVYIIFLIFAQKYRLWVLAEAVLTSTHNLCFEQKYEKNIRVFFYLKIFSFWR